MAEHAIPSLHDLEIRLAAARCETSAPVARATLRQIVVNAEHSDVASEGTGDVAILGAAALAELAAMEGDVDTRLALRRQAIAFCMRHTRAGGVPPRVAVAHANRIVDHFYDSYAQEDRPTMVSALAQASHMLGSISADAGLSNHDRARALGQRSSVIRCQAAIAPRETRMSRIGEAIRCAELAVELSPADPLSNLELGQTLWASARWAQSDEDCYRALQRAEASILKACDGSEPVTFLVLARFYRLSYRPAQAVSVFRDYLARDAANRRRGLSESFLIGEASVQMWFNGYPAETTTAALEMAFAQLSEAASAGYENARIFCALAFTQAALGRPEASDLTLRRLSMEPVSSWLEIISRAENALDNDDFTPLRKAFSIGVGDGSVWNALGTFAARFLKQDDVALRLYDVAKRLRPVDPVILTNIARVYLRRGTVDDLALADSALDVARAHAPRTFLWWRGIRSEVALARGQAPSSPKRASAARDITKKTKFGELQKRYLALKTGSQDGSIASQQRGYLIQDIVTDLLSISFQAIGSHEFHGRQVDAAFFYAQRLHRVEVKWKQEPLDSSDLDGLHQRLNQAEVRGVVISMSGFRDTAVEYAREIGRHHAVILMDGVELESVLLGHLRFETLLERKLENWSLRGDPYYKSDNETAEA